MDGQLKIRCVLHLGECSTKVSYTMRFQERAHITHARDEVLFAVPMSERGGLDSESVMTDVCIFPVRSLWTVLVYFESIICVHIFTTFL